MSTHGSGTELVCSKNGIGIADMGTTALEDLETPPSSGYSGVIFPASGNSYWIKLNDGYAKFRINSISSDGMEIEFCYISS